MTIVIKHAKTNNVTDWTQSQLDAIIAGSAAPLPPLGTVLNDVVLPSDWNANITTSMATGKLVGRSTAGTGGFEEISAGASLSLSAGSLGLNISNANSWAALQTFGNNISFGGAQLNVTSLATGNVLQYNGTNWINVAASSLGGMSIGGAVSSGTTGSVLFVGSGSVLAQDNTNFFWNATNNRLTASGGLTMLYQNIYPVQRAIPTTIGNAVDIGAFTLTAGTGNFEMWITVPSAGYSQSKRYFLPASYNGTSNTWQTVLPISTTGAYLGEDFDLEINSNNLVTSFRLRRTGSTTAGTANIIIIQQGVQTDAFTPSTSSGAVSAPTVIYTNTLLTQLSGKVGVNIQVPATNLHINSSTSATATNNSILISRYSRPATSGVKYGNSMDILLGSYGTGINSQSKVDFKLADGATNDPDTVILTLSANGSVNIPILTALQLVGTDASKNLVSVNAPIILSTTTGIDGKAVANTALYTVPIGKTAVITGYIVRVSAASSITIGPAAGIGNVAGTNNISASQVMNALTSTTSVFNWQNIGTAISTPASGIIYYNQGTAATGTSETVVVDLIGYIF